ncbi:Gfo/Idh/MocA family oxidoreductase [bacterium]|nr:Gfo/Idh/MocA family oxidoreductase [bacterium]
MNKNTIRFGIIGAGNKEHRRGNSLIKQLSVLKNIEVTAVYDIVRNNTKFDTQGKHEPRWFTDFTNFLNSGLDAVVISSPPKFHTEQAIAMLKADIHVLSEVPAVVNIKQIDTLIEAERKSCAYYMIAENCCFRNDIELVKRLVDEAFFGDIYYAEAEYVHDCKYLWRNKKGDLTWRGRGELGVYCTHSLGPLLYILNDSVERVSCICNSTKLIDPDHELCPEFNHTMFMNTRKGRIIRVRVDLASPRPFLHFYGVQGTHGAFESGRGFSDKPRIMLAETKNPSLRSSKHTWTDLDDFMRQYIPERLQVKKEMKLGGHGTTEYWMLTEFISAIRSNRQPVIGLNAALNYTLPGIYARESIVQGGKMLKIPDFKVKDRNLESY